MFIYTVGLVVAVTYAYCATAVRDESSDIATLTLTIALTLYTITEPSDDMVHYLRSCILSFAKLDAVFAFCRRFVSTGRDAVRVYTEASFKSEDHIHDGRIKHE